MLLDNEEIKQITAEKWKQSQKLASDALIMEPFQKDFCYRFCWDSNSIEGNTLSLDETVQVIEYDEVQSGHTYTEYQEALSLYYAIKEEFCFEGREVTETWLKRVNGKIIRSDGEYRKKNVYIGTLAEAVYYPPDPDRVPKLVEELLQFQPEGTFLEALEDIAKEHILFERIHPFLDGNGRTGRVLLNQRLVNAGMLPITIVDHAKYRQAFRRFEKSQDLSLMVRLICNGEIKAMERLEMLGKKQKMKPIRIR